MVCDPVDRIGENVVDRNQSWAKAALTHGLRVSNIFRDGGVLPHRHHLRKSRSISTLMINHPFLRECFVRDRGLGHDKKPVLVLAAVLRPFHHVRHLQPSQVRARPRRHCPRGRHRRRNRVADMQESRAARLLPFLLVRDHLRNLAPPTQMLISRPFRHDRRPQPKLLDRWCPRRHLSDNYLLLPLPAQLLLKDVCAMTARRAISLPSQTNATQIVMYPIGMPNLPLLLLLLRVRLF